MKDELLDFLGIFFIVVAGVVALVALLCIMDKEGYDRGYNNGYWQGITSICEGDMHGKVMSLPNQDRVQCVQYDVPAPLFPTKKG